MKKNEIKVMDFLLKERGIYAVVDGKMKGEFFVFVKEKSTYDVYAFISLPDQKVRYTNRKNIEDGLNLNVLEFIETLPKDVYKICKESFSQQEKHQNETIN